MCLKVLGSQDGAFDVISTLWKYVKYVHEKNSISNNLPIAGDEGIDSGDKWIWNY